MSRVRDDGQQVSCSGRTSVRLPAVFEKLPFNFENVSQIAARYDHAMGSVRPCDGARPDVKLGFRVGGGGAEQITVCCLHSCPQEFAAEEGKERTCIAQTSSAKTCSALNSECCVERNDSLRLASRPVGVGTWGLCSAMTATSAQYFVPDWFGTTW